MDPQILIEMEKLARAKAIIRKLESSDGQNVNHAELTQGPNKGQRAGGAYGIVPNSLKDFIQQSKNRGLPVDEDMVKTAGQPHDQVTKRLNEDKDFDNKAAEMALKLILKKAQGDEAKAAYAWRTGHNQSLEAMARGAAEHPYVQAYNKEKVQYDLEHQPERSPAEKPVESADMLGKLKNFFGF